MRYQKEGLPEGVGVGESINREGMRRAIDRRSQSFTMNSQHASRLAGLAGTMGQSFSSDASKSEKRTDDDEMKTSDHSNRSGSGTGKRTDGDGREAKKWGLGFASNKGSEKSAKSDDPGERGWGSTAFRSTVADNLDSIMEVVDENSGSFTANGSSSFKKEAQLDGSSSSINKEESPVRAELVGNVKARVQEKLAKRLAKVEHKSPELQMECARIDDNTALAVGGSVSLNHSSEGDEFGSGEFRSDEFESPATHDRLLSRLGAKDKS